MRMKPSYTDQPGLLITFTRVTSERVGLLTTLSTSHVITNILSFKLLAVLVRIIFAQPIILFILLQCGISSGHSPSIDLVLI